MNESRAYIIFTKPRVYGLKIDSAVSIENPFTNIGKTPAYNLRAYTTIMFGKHENDFDIKKMGNNGIDSAIVMVALATNESHYIETYEDGVYTKERDTFLKNNKLFLFIFSEIFYTDVFQKDHLAIQFMKYDIDKNDFTFCENGNFSN